MRTPQDTSPGPQGVHTRGVPLRRGLRPHRRSVSESSPPEAASASICSTSSWLWLCTSVPSSVGGCWATSTQDSGGEGRGRGRGRGGEGEGRGRGGGGEGRGERSHGSVVIWWSVS